MRYCPDNKDACKNAAFDARRKQKVAGTRTLSLAGGLGFFEAFEATRGYLADWRPKGKTEIMLGQVKSILEEYADNLPLTIRQIYYRVIGEFRHPKGKEFERSLYTLLDNARRAEEIKFRHIRDDGIQSQGGGGYHELADLIWGWRWGAEHWDRNVQDGQPYKTQVWCEAAGMVPQLARVCRPYDIGVFSGGGFGSITAVRQIVQDCLTQGPTLLLHLGDCDPSGYSIYQSMVEDAHAFLKIDRQRRDAEDDAEDDRDPEFEYPDCPCTTPDCDAQFYFERAAARRALSLHGPDERPPRRDPRRRHGPDDQHLRGDAGDLARRRWRRARPSVATSVGAVPGALRGCGIVAPPGEVHAIATAIVTLLRNPDLAAQLGRRGYERLHRRYTLKRCVAAYRDLINELIGATH
jgi:hypothetical protein